MAEKRYQVFVSSTFRDLEKERWEAVKALMTMDCIVAGMESFPAVDEEQFEYIKEIIDDCDYYLLILGGRYGSLAPDGVGYTEKEYDYARSRDIKVIALVREAPESLPPEKRETDAAQLDRFIRFREKVCADRLVSFWRDERDIQKDVALGMAKAMKKFPAVGWVRGDSAASEKLIQENFDLKRQLDSLVKNSTDENSLCMNRLNAECVIFYITELTQEKKNVSSNFREIFMYIMDDFINGIGFHEAKKLILNTLSYIIKRGDRSINSENITILTKHDHIINRLILLKIIDIGEINVIDSGYLRRSHGYKLTDFGRNITVTLAFS